VADFGIALALQEAGGGRLTETGLSMGTPYYMSPEQATADRDPDARSDVYSLGSPPGPEDGQRAVGGTSGRVDGRGRQPRAHPDPPGCARRSFGLA